MAEVFRAVYQGAAGVEKVVALKRILPALHGATDFVNMFIDEARIASSLTHVNVAQVFEFGEANGAYYLTMELIEGSDLGRLLEAARKQQMLLPHPVVAFLVAEAARGLAYAHDKRGPSGASAGIVHRDVSPQNVLVSFAGEVKIADFGIAKAAGKLHKTESGAVMGKLRYMSPEQITGEPLDGRSDLFSLGVVLHELLTGKQLFDGDNPGRVAEQVKRAEVAPPSAIVADVPAELDRICLKALARDRGARYERAADMARDLSTFVSSRAPGLTREDVGALVTELVRGTQLPEPGDEPLGEAATIAAVAAFSPGPTPALSRAPSPLSPLSPSSLAAPTRLDKRTEPSPAPVSATEAASSAAAPRRSGALLLVGGVAAAAFAAGIGWRLSHAPGETPVAAVVDAGTIAVAPSEDAAIVEAGPSVTPAERARLLAELEALPRADATWRGVPSEDYLAVLSAVDGALCASAGAEPVFPPDAEERVKRQRLEAETRAVARYSLATGELPPRVGAALQSFLRAHPAYSPGAGGWAMAALASRLDPAEVKHRFELLRENGALHRWRERPAFAAPPPSGLAALCDRQEVVSSLAARAPGPRSEALKRFLAATPVEASIDEGGLRYAVTGAVRDEAAATLEVRLRVTNPGADEKPLALEGWRLSGLTAAPSVEPPAPRLGGGLVREARLVFSGVTDGAAEAAVLVVRPGVELQAHSDFLR